MDSTREGLLSRGPQHQQQNSLGYFEDGTPIQTPPPLYSSSFQDDARDRASNQQDNYRPADRLGGINFAGWQPLLSVPDGEDHGDQEQQAKENSFRDQDPSFDDRPVYNLEISNKPGSSYTREDGPDSVYVSKLRPWSSWWNMKHLPWKSLVPLVLCFASIGASLYTAYRAENRPVKDWSFPIVGDVQPSAILAFFSAITNSLMLLAFTNAWVTMFWLQAMKPGGVPITDLHYHTQGAMGLTGALSALLKGRSIGISLVCIMIAASSIARGPLIQRAVSVQTYEFSVNGTIDLPIMRSVTNGWGGIFNEHSGNDMASFDEGFSQAIRDFQAKTPIHIPGLGQPCENCSFTVNGFGFDVMNCTEKTTPYHIFERWNPGPDFFKLDNNATFYEVNIDFRPEYPSEQGSWNWIYSTAPLGIETSIRRKTDPDCKGQTTTRVCYLSPSRMKYKLFMDKGSNVTFQSSDWKSDVVVENVTLQIHYPYRNATNTIVPLWLFAKNLFESRAMLYEGSGDHDMTYSGLGGYLYHREHVPGTRRCWGTWDDPFDDIMNSYRDLGLRLSIREAMEKRAEAENLRAIGNMTDADALMEKVMQKGVEFVSNQASLRYVVDKGKLWLGLGVSFIGPLATLILLLWQWWGRAMFMGSPGLGRTFSMSPLEIANAFFGGGGGGVPVARRTTMSTSYPPGSGSESTSKADSSLAGAEMEVDQGDYHNLNQQQHTHTLAPILEGCSSNSSASQIVKHIRQRTIAMNGKGGLVRNKEPRVQYGVEESSGRLAFVIIERGEDGETAVRRPKSKEML
ncbi:hypothetical protein QBC45DRAFT_426362 [Copromyces sp. CBS 386.78]|nr:hypothetical protein QBC45DRAFT_426362 [Copromyces sp. CBS 386.78]